MSSAIRRIYIMSKFAVMLFKTGLELGTMTEPGVWVNYNNIYTDDPTEALYLYSEIPCPASQLIKGTDEYDLQCKMGEMILNFQNEDWLNENLYPYL